MVVDVVVVVDDAVRPIPMAACGRGRTKAALRRGRWCISNVIIIDDDRVAAAKAAAVVAAMRISISAAGAWGVLGFALESLWLWLWRYHQLDVMNHRPAHRPAPHLHLRGGWRRPAARRRRSKVRASAQVFLLPIASRQIDDESISIYYERPYNCYRCAPRTKCERNENEMRTK